MTLMDALFWTFLSLLGLALAVLAACGAVLLGYMLSYVVGTWRR